MEYVLHKNTIHFILDIFITSSPCKIFSLFMCIVCTYSYIHLQTQLFIHPLLPFTMMSWKLRRGYLRKHASTSRPIAVWTLACVNETLAHLLYPQLVTPGVVNRDTVDFNQEGIPRKSILPRRSRCIAHAAISAWWVDCAGSHRCAAAHSVRTAQCA